MTFSCQAYLDAIDNPRLVRLKQKTLGWQFTTVYIPGKLLGGTDALSRYGVCHCTEKEFQHIVNDNSLSDRQHLIGLVATATTNPMTPVITLLLDTDTHLITNMCSLPTTHPLPTDLPRGDSARVAGFSTPTLPCQPTPYPPVRQLTLPQQYVYALITHASGVGGFIN
jgi:hypothetical protein